LTKTAAAGAVAAVARSDAGEFLGASAVLVEGITEPETLEALAVREGINLAQDLQLTKIKIATDCISVAQAMKENNISKYYHIIQEVKIGAAGFAEAIVVHENRRSNKEPHELARLVSSMPGGRYVWLVDPSEGVCIPKLVMI
jgi:ribonuclease HI